MDYNEYLNPYEKSQFDLDNYLCGFKNDPKYRKALQDSSDYLTVALSTPSIENEISHYLASRYNISASQYDKAIDSRDNQTHVGGSTLHHNLDDNHTWLGAIKALQEKFPDDSEAQNIYHALVHFSKDCTTPSGINPFLNPSEFIDAKQSLVEHFHFTPSLANDLLNINVAELCAASVAAISLILSFDKLKADKLGQQVARLSIASYFAGNPAMFLITAVCIGRIFYLLWTESPVEELAKGTLQGALQVAAVLKISAFIHPSMFVGIVVTAVAYFGVNWLYNQASSFINEDINVILSKQFPMYRSYKL